MTQITPAQIRANQPATIVHAGAAPARQRSADAWGFLEFFILAQVVLPALLFLPGTQSLRVPIRVAPFAMGLAGFYFLLTSRRLKPHPTRSILVLILLYLAVMIASPNTNTPVAGLAQVVLYFSVMAPVFWAPALVRSERQLGRIMAILLICNGLNATLGVLQVKYPDTFMPRQLSTVLTDQGDSAIGKYIGPNGEEIIRPPGFSDLPGAVCAPASVAALLGLIMALRPIGIARRIGSLAFAFAGITAIFLSHVRTSILVLCGMYVVYVVMLLIQGDARRATILLAGAAAMCAVALLFAATLGGESVVDRFATLCEDDPATVYYNSMRGVQLQYDTQAYLADYPLGAGLGRWGMMRLYFGDEDDNHSEALWAEVQWPAWVLDGGIVLLLLYNVALVVNSIYEFSLCRRLGQTRSGPFAAMIFASNAGVIALMLGFTPFTTQIGLQYWFLAGVLHGISQAPQREAA